MTRIDFSQIETREVIPNGTYEADWGDYEIRDSQDGESQMANVQFVITEAPYEGRKLYRNFSFKPTALWGLKQAAIRAGAEPEIFDGEVEIEDVLDELKGAQVRIRVAVKKFEGEERNDVRSVLTPETDFATV